MKDKKREFSQILSKLDPLLLLGVERADKEDIKSLKAVKEKLPSVKSLHPGIQSLQRHMSDTNLKRFLRTDKVSVMVATTDNKAVAKVVADKRKQPCVINLSLGGHFGGHDGTTIAERTIDQLCGPGKLVVVSAGNENQSPIHASTILPKEQPEPTRWVADFELRPGIYDGRMLGFIVLQVWYHHEDLLTVQLRSPIGELFTAPMEMEKDNYYVSVNHETAHYSGDNVVTIRVITLPLTQLLGGWSIIVTESTTGGVKVGSVHAWILSRNFGSFTGGNSQSCLVGMPGTAYSAITVASYATRKEWESQSLTQPHITLDAMNLEDISYFSSEGPTRDGQNKPEIAAPGQYLVSTLSSDAQPVELPMEYRVKDIDYLALQGTSMAAPYVTGALALLLEKDGTIDWAEAKRRLIKSARLGTHTGPCWNPRWGYGKINVEKLLTIEPT